MSPTALLSHARRLLALCAVLLVLAGSGRGLLSFFKTNPESLQEELALSFALGYGFWGTLLHLMGLAGWWQRKALQGLWAAAALVSLKGLLTLRRKAAEAFASRGAMAPSAAAAVAALSMVNWLYWVRYAMIPETFYDALEYHLGLPNLYLLRHGIIAAPENSFSGIPSLPSMLYGWTLCLDPWGILAGLLHASILPWVGIALWALGRRLGRPSAGLYAFAIFALTPTVIGESFRISVGLEWALIQTLCIACFLAALKTDLSSPERRGWVLLCAVQLGLAMATKYPAWLIPAALAAAWLYAGRQDEHSPANITKSEAVLLIAVATLLLAPWVLRSLWHYKNPLFPFFHEKLFPDAVPMPDWRYLSGSTADLRSLFSVSGIAGYLKMHWRLLNGSLNDSIGLSYFALLPALFLVRLPRDGRLLAVLCLSLWLPLSLLSGVARYFIPHLAVLALLLALAVEEARPEWIKKVLLCVMAVSLIVTGAAARLLDKPMPSKLEVFAGRIDYDGYLAHHNVSYPSPPYAGIDFINKNSPHEAKVLFFGDSRTFHLRRPAVASTPDQNETLVLWSNQSHSGKELRDRFNDRQVSYILVNHAEIARLKRPMAFSARGKASLDEFWSRYTLREFSIREFPDRWVDVFKVLTEDEANTPHPVVGLFSDYSIR